jgi:hypothetical protein
VILNTGSIEFLKVVHDTPTPWSRGLLEMLAIPQLVKKFRAFCET